MNKKILISLSIIAAVAAIVVGGTIAYFSDTETSTGNLFAAGSIDLKIDNTSYLNGVAYATTTWTLNDLTDQLFFKFSDLKPGDWGEDTVSMHVYNNDAWACVTFDSLVNNDNTCTEPEGVAESLTVNCGLPDTGYGAGELAQELEFRFWADMCYDPSRNAVPGDNKFTVGTCVTGDDVYLMSGNASDLGTGPVTYALADSNGSVFPVGLLRNGALIGSNDYYIAKVWCFGDLNYTVVAGSKVWTCNGAPVTNVSQSDSLTGDIEFYAVQSRNNPDFTCIPD